MNLHTIGMLALSSHRLCQRTLPMNVISAASRQNRWNLLPIPSHNTFPGLSPDKIDPNIIVTSVWSHLRIKQR